jgi:8-oxo-dGTP diphosphatase
MKNCTIVVECILHHNNRFLLIERPQGVHAGGLLAFPGGKVEVDDAKDGQDVLEAALAREVFEEVGITFESAPQYVMNSYFMDSKNNPVLDVIFYASFKTLPTIIPSAREVVSHAWLLEDELKAAKNCPPWVLLYLERARTLYA